MFSIIGGVVFALSGKSYRRFICGVSIFAGDVPVWSTGHEPCEDADNAHKNTRQSSPEIHANNVTLSVDDNALLASYGSQGQDNKLKFTVNRSRTDRAVCFRVEGKKTEIRERCEISARQKQRASEAIGLDVTSSKIRASDCVAGTTQVKQKTFKSEVKEMAIDDRLGKALEFYSQELETDLPKKALKLVIDQIPHFGNHINKILFGDVQRRVAERAQDVFEAVKQRVERMDESKIDKDFLKSDEFMTLLVLAIDQLQTTHDKQKIKMLANALANSGVAGFSTDARKELYMRIFRDLAPEHIEMLQQMRRKFVPNAQMFLARDRRGPRGMDLAVLQSLAADGLVDEYEERDKPTLPIASYSNQREITKAIESLMAVPAMRCFRVNRFGEDFLRFFDDLEAPSDENSTPPTATSDA